MADSTVTLDAAGNGGCGGQGRPLLAFSSHHAAAVQIHPGRPTMLAMLFPASSASRSPSASACTAV
eukprot:6421779-Pyramimonas_sp.AAC.1